MDGRYGEYGEDDAWNAGGDDGQGYDGYDYNYNQDNSENYSGNYGYNSGNKAWEAPKNTNTDSIIAKINQRLDMLSQLECDKTSGQHNRFAPYESYDSRSSMNDHDPYRSGYGYGYGDSGPNYNDSYGGHYDHYDNSYGTRRDQYHNRAYSSQRGQNWSRDWAPNKRANWNDPYMQPGGSRRMSGHWNEPMGGRGFNAASSTRNLPSLFSPNIIPMDLFRAQGSARAFGGRLRRRDKNRNRGRKKVIGGPGRKRKQSTSSTEDPENKQAKTDDGEDSDAEDKEDDGAESGGEDKDSSEKGEKKPKRFPTMQEKKKTGKPKKNRDRLAERITYACSVCKFRTFEDEEIAAHMKSKFHKETLKFIGTKLKAQTADFLDEYIANKNKKTQKRREQIGDETILKKQLMQQHDVLQGIGMEQCMKKVEAAHCMACELFIPMQTGFIGQHLRSAEHNRNRKMAIERAKKGSLVIAKSILNNSNIATMLEKYVKGEKPFTDDPDDKDEEEGGMQEGDGDGEGDGLNDSMNDGEKREGEEGEGDEEIEGGDGEQDDGEHYGEQGGEHDGEQDDGEEHAEGDEGEETIDRSEDAVDVADEDMEAEGEPEAEMEDLGEGEDDATESKDPEEPFEADEDKILEGEDDALPFDTELE
ncbi:A-kinase anchor protein 8-like isoform X1 [Hemiscyllium ocellatum]|uniref:A-kinase anchor protein 8-like isoform X1 n=1 Tax=Hemiscyllium ocellatum TaxID=170820 RepID=UPI0029670A22|nr:A-kinase anchor protein 8-like isoform X1 [Hemiscyllium ocellatum]